MAQSTKKRSLAGLTSLDDWLATEDFGEEVTLRAMKRVIALQLGEEMRAKRISKSELAKRMKTSRAQVDSLLDPARNVTLESLSRAAQVMGRKVRLELV
jgi:antitoxin HicB